MSRVVFRTLATQSKSRNYDQVLTSPHFESNLKLVKIAIPEDESEAEKNYRIKFQELQEWNHNYWSKQNKSFLEEKEKFIKNEMQVKKMKGSSETTLTYEELSIFYKKFLEDRQNKHVQYSWEWYSRHLGLVIPAFKSLAGKFWRQRNNFKSTK